MKLNKAICKRCTLALFETDERMRNELPRFEGGEADIVDEFEERWEQGHVVCFPRALDGLVAEAKAAHVDIESGECVRYAAEQVVSQASVECVE